MKLRTNYLLAATMAASLSQGVALASEDDAHHDTDHSTEHAGGISYDFIDITYMDVAAEEDGDGFLLRGFKGLGDSFYLLSEYGDANLDHHGDFSFGRLGLGAHTSFSDSVDGIAELTYESLELNEDHHHFDETGYGLAVGVRALFTEHWEGTARLRYVDFGHEDDLIFGAELLYLFNHSFGLVLGYEKGNEKILSFGLKFQF